MRYNPVSSIYTTKLLQAVMFTEWSANEYVF